ncbi:hypothetical protein sr17428 [Sporisorium reilianum SRZ2]|uniref:Uncharacterized protein n=1 Tax=Sporisorium reilianum (strain SRZ2) TaxID=999809 RepID=E7A2V9_SPORE|nr:hypothetical protein sr17428 [Sporisorium reilianum SRZ2]
MGEPGRTCACTPRSLLVPAGGVTTLDPSQRVSAQELQAKDREWQRQRQSQSEPEAPLSGASSDTATVRGDSASVESGAKAKTRLISTSLFGRKGGKTSDSNG